jgi:hypothetical protein
MFSYYFSYIFARLHSLTKDYATHKSNVHLHNMLSATNTTAI